MAVKTFSTGEVLTASDTNTYLANSGLVYTTSTAFTSQNVVTITNCFTSVCDLYRVTLTTTAMSANQNLWFQLMAGSTPAASDYYWGTTSVSHSGATGVGNGSGVTLVNPSYTSSLVPQGFQTVELFGPYLSIPTTFTLTDIRHDSVTEVYRSGGGLHYVASSYSGIRFGLGSTATMTGVLTVMGYRKA